MELTFWRDIVIIIWALVASVAMVFIAVMLFKFYRKTVSLLESTDLLVAKANSIVDYVDDELVRPVGRLGTMFQGIVQGISIFSSIFRKKEN